MVLSKKVQREQRRAAILELAAQGLTQEAIAKRLEVFHITQRTVSRDLDYLRRQQEHSAHRHWYAAKSTFDKSPRQFNVERSSV
jgi:arginine repressor